jgi:predicted RNA-binding Zn ribbon-like protein
MSDVTGQVVFDSYASAGALTAVELVNACTATPDRAADPHAELERILAIDPPSLAVLRDADGPEFVALAVQLRDVFAALDRDDLGAAAQRLNDLLARHPAHPHLAADDDGRWRLHHHPTDAALVPMWTSICAEGLARIIGAGDADRLGTCAAADCDRVFLDGSRNASRRFCSTTCQNRVKAATFRRRHVAPTRRTPERGLLA